MPVTEAFPLPRWVREAEQQLNCSITVTNEDPFKKAKKLFIKHLSPQQYETFINYNYIIVRSNKGHKYRINTGSLYINIKRIDGWFFKRRWFCMQLKNIECPKYDHLLAQKLIIESDEKRFLAVANRYY